MGLLDKMRGNAGDARPATVTDPVCGMRIDPARAAGTSAYEGRTVHFCSPGCKQSFDKDPAKYASKLA